MPDRDGNGDRDSEPANNRERPLGSVTIREVEPDDKRYEHQRRC